MSFQLPTGAFQCRESYFTYWVSTATDDGSSRIVLVLSSAFLGKVLAASTATNREGLSLLLDIFGKGTAPLLLATKSTEADSSVINPSSAERKEPPGGQPLPSVISMVMPRLRASSITAIT